MNEQTQSQRRWLTRQKNWKIKRNKTECHLTAYRKHCLRFFIFFYFPLLGYTLPFDLFVIPSMLLWINSMTFIYKMIMAEWSFIAAVDNIQADSSASKHKYFHICIVVVEFILKYNINVHDIFWVNGAFCFCYLITHKAEGGLCTLMDFIFFASWRK